METVELSLGLASWQGMIDRAKSAADAMGKKVSSLEEELKAAKHQSNTAAYARTILAGVLEGWKKQDPGKYGPAYRFLAGGRTVVAEELLTAEDLALAREKRISVVPLERVMHDPCPKCGPGKLLPVIEEYHQTADSYDGDTWTKRRLVACLDCSAVYQCGATLESDHRF